MTQLAVIDPREITITPVFKHIQVENIAASEKAGYAVMEPLEVVEVRFAGQRNFSPVFPATAVWQREGNQDITYAERWAEQYRAFKQGDPQEAMGTPLESLKPHGITPEMISLCRALKIYSIEALYALEGPGLKALGMNGNALKDAARAFMAERLTGQQAQNEIEALKARIAELEASGAKVAVPAEQTPPEDIDAAVALADGEFAGKSDDDLKAEIALLSGSKPRGTPTRETLESSVRELRQAKAA
jgi:hypothetical protein